jgi:hypothetical protein
MSLKAVYISAGNDLIPVLSFPNILEFVYIDRTLPSKKILREHGFVLMSEMENIYMYFANGTQVIKYYKCNFPIQMNDLLRSDLSDCNAVILYGRDQHVSILDYIKSKPALIISERVSQYNPCYMKFKGHPEISSDIYMFKEPREEEEDGMTIDIYEAFSTDVCFV